MSDRKLPMHDSMVSHSKMSRRYEGKPCHKGHTSRYIKTGHCVACGIMASSRSTVKARGSKPSRMIDIDHLREKLDDPLSDMNFNLNDPLGGGSR